MITIITIFFSPTQKSPHFLWGLSSRTGRSFPQSQQRCCCQPRHCAQNEDDFNHVDVNQSPLPSLRELWQLFPTHYGAWHATIPHIHGLGPDLCPVSLMITTNTLIHSPSNPIPLLCLSPTPPESRVILWHAGESGVVLCVVATLILPGAHMHRSSKNKHPPVWDRLLRPKWSGVNAAVTSHPWVPATAMSILRQWLDIGPGLAWAHASDLLAQSLVWPHHLHVQFNVFFLTSVNTLFCRLVFCAKTLFVMHVCVC